MDREITMGTRATKVNDMSQLIELCETGLGLAVIPRFAVTSGCSDLKQVYCIPENL